MSGRTESEGERPVPIQCENWPPTLHRCFRSREHAEQFLSGRIRFGHLQHYQRNYEPSRRDPSEGVGRAREWRDDREAVHIKGGRARVVASPGEITRHADFGNPTFICCCTNPPEGKWAPVLKDFGEYVVRITDPKQFCTDLRGALSDSDPWQRHGNLAVFPVTYDKGELRPTSADPPDGTEVMKLATTQKPREYEHQFEHRIILISYGDVPKDGKSAGTPPDFI